MRAIAFALLCAASLNAQIAAELRHPPNRSPQVEILNNSTVPVAAFAITMPRIEDGPPFIFFRDTTVDTAFEPIAPNQSYAVDLQTRLLHSGRVEPTFGPPIITAAIFSDGTTAGDAALVSRLFARRADTLQAVELARDLLYDAGRRNVPREQLIAQFQKLADSLDHWYLPPEQRAGRALYQSIVANLTNLPQLPGSAFPPTPFVEQQTAALTRVRAALLESIPR